MRRTLGIAVRIGMLVTIAMLSFADASAASRPHQSATPGVTAIVGVLLDAQDRAVAGVEVSVAQADATIGSATSDEQGRWRVEVPGAGTYQVTLNVDTLPEGVGLRNPDLATLDRVRVRDGLEKPVRFLLGERAVNTVSTFERFANLTLEGIRLGIILAVASIGLSLIFAVTGLTNFAHGELVTFGALIAWFLSTGAGGPGLPLVLAALAAMPICAAWGFAHERLIFRPLRRRRSGNVALIVVTIGLGLFLRNLFLLLFEGRPRAYDEYTVQVGLDLGVLSPRAKDLAIIAVGALVLAGYALVLQRTRLGTAMRAVADNRDLSAASGIDVDRIIVLTWSGGAALAGLGGVFAGISDSVQFDMGFGLLLLMFAAVVVGGLGTAYGPLVGGLIIGVSSQVSTYWISTKYRLAVSLVALILAVLLRPQGILGKKERIG
jgi:branched-chain amino acid transport system permease protein